MIFSEVFICSSTVHGLHRVVKCHRSIKINGHRCLAGHARYFTTSPANRRSSQYKTFPLLGIASVSIGLTLYIKFYMPQVYEQFHGQITGLIDSLRQKPSSGRVAVNTFTKQFDTLVTQWNDAVDRLIAEKASIMQKDPLYRIAHKVSPSIVHVELVQHQLFRNSVRLVLDECMGAILNADGLVMFDGRILDRVPTVRADHPHSTVVRVSLSNGRVLTNKPNFEMLKQTRLYFASLAVMPLTDQKSRFLPLERSGRNRMSNEKHDEIIFHPKRMIFLKQSFKHDKMKEVVASMIWKPRVVRIDPKIVGKKLQNTALLAINFKPGDSIKGGPILDKTGRLVGFLTPSNANQGVVIPLSMMKANLAKLELLTKAQRTFNVMLLGYSGAFVNADDIADYLRLNATVSNSTSVKLLKPGFLVRLMQKRGLSFKAGVRPGDIITHVDEEPFRDITQLAHKLTMNKQVRLTILRESQTHEILMKG